MAHYAFLNDQNIVTEVIVGTDESDTSQNWEQFYGDFRGQTCRRTSYNNNIRKNFAGVGFTYDETRNAFIPPKPYASWTLNEDTCLWDCPIVYPDDGAVYVWNEELGNWESSE